MFLHWEQKFVESLYTIYPHLTQWVNGGKILNVPTTLMGSFKTY